MKIWRFKIVDNFKEIDIEIPSKKNDWMERRRFKGKPLENKVFQFLHCSQSDSET